MLPQDPGGVQLGGGAAAVLGVGRGPRLPPHLQHVHTQELATGDDLRYILNTYIYNYVIYTHNNTTLILLLKITNKNVLSPFYCFHTCIFLCFVRLLLYKVLKGQTLHLSTSAFSECSSFLC